MIAPKRPVGKTSRPFRVLAWTGLCFLLGQIAASLVLDYHFPGIRFLEFVVARDNALKLGVSPDIVCLGSSRFGTGLHTGEMTRILRDATDDAEVLVYNASVPAGDFLTSRRMLDELLQQGIRPRLLVLEICPDVVNERMHWLGFHIGRWMHWEDLPAFAGDIVRDGFTERFLKVKLLPLVQYRGGIRAELASIVAKSTPRQMRNDGERLASLDSLIKEWRAEEKPPSERPPLVKPKALAYNFRHFRIGGHPERELRTILERCRSLDIPVLLVGVPVATCHREYYVEIETEYQAFIDRIVAEHGVTSIDYRTLVPDEEFADHHHPAHAGMLRFTRTLTRDVLAQRWQQIRKNAEAHR